MSPAELFFPFCERINRTFRKKEILPLFFKLIGPARISTQDQDTAAQIAALEPAGCELIFQEKGVPPRKPRNKVVELWKLCVVRLPEASTF